MCIFNKTSLQSRPFCTPSTYVFPTTLTYLYLRIKFAKCVRKLSHTRPIFFLIHNPWMVYFLNASAEILLSVFSSFLYIALEVDLIKKHSIQHCDTYTSQCLKGNRHSEQFYSRNVPIALLEKNARRIRCVLWYLNDIERTPCKYWRFL